MLRFRAGLRAAGAHAVTVNPPPRPKAWLRAHRPGRQPRLAQPWRGALEEAYNLFELVYDSMFQLQLDGSFTPELAQSYTVSDDGKVWTFKIREGVKFHDGQPLTAADVAFSYNLYKSHADFPFLNPYTAYFDSD